MKTSDIVTKYFEYVNSGDWDSYLTLFADDVVMHEQMAGELIGIDAVKSEVEELKKSTFFKNHLIDFVAEENRAMARWHLETILPNGNKVEVNGVNYYEIENGKISRFSNYHDTEPFILASEK